VCAIGPIRLLALASYRSLTNQILIFGILDLNFQSEFQQYAGSSLASSVLLCGVACYAIRIYVPVMGAFRALTEFTSFNSKQFFEDSDFNARRIRRQPD